MFNFFSFFRNSVAPPPVDSHYLPRDYDYEYIISRYNDATSYLELYEIAKKNNHVYTTIEIKFSSKVSFGASMKEIKNIMFAPNHTIRNVANLNADILFYKVMVGEYRTNLEMHFFKNRLFFYNYIFHLNNPNDEEKIMEVIRQKYLSHLSYDEISNLNLRSTSIFDPKERCLFIQKDDFNNFTINYFISNSNFFEHIRRIAEKQEKISEERKKAKEKELFIRL